MDWQANLDAIIKCTDDNLRQQFEAHKFSPAPPLRPFSQYSAMAFRPPSPTTTSHFQPAMTSPPMPPPPPPPSTPQQSFPSYAPYPASHDNNNAPPPPTHDYSSFHQTYNIAHMMEQIRFSIKLEVDARAAIAERQLSAIMALTKSNSDELDRLRLEANTTDREVRGLDQAHQKLRQDMTTQKDIMYHVQSMAGKDESWRMQADNQLLELRQVIAAMREQLNSLQVSMQEKLSRPELLVHFNACVEPLKAQLNAGIQHQAQIIGELSRKDATHSYVVESIEKHLRELDTHVQTVRLDVESISKRHPPDRQAVPSRTETSTDGTLSMPQVESVVEHIWLGKCEALESKWAAAHDLHCRQVQTALDESDVRLKRWQGDVDNNTNHAAKDSTQQITKMESLVTEGQSTLKALIAQSAAATTQIIRDEVERERSERKRQLDGLTDQLMQVKYSTHDSVHKGLHDIRIELKADLTAHDKELQAFCMSVVAKDVPPMLRKDVSEWQEVVQRVQEDVAQIRQETIHCTNVMTVLQNDMQAQRKDVADHKTSLGTMGTDLSALKKEVESTTKIIQGQIDTILKDRVEGERSLQRRMEVEVTTLVQKGVVPFEQELRRINTRLDDLKKQEPISTPATASMMGPPPSPGYGYWPPHMYAMASPPNHSMDAHYRGGNMMHHGYHQPNHLMYTLPPFGVPEMPPQPLPSLPQDSATVTQPLGKQTIDLPSTVAASHVVHQMPTPVPSVPAPVPPTAGSMEVIPTETPPPSREVNITKPSSPQITLATSHPVQIESKGTAQPPTAAASPPRVLVPVTNQRENVANTLQSSPGISPALSTLHPTSPLPPATTGLSAPVVPVSQTQQVMSPPIRTSAADTSTLSNGCNTTAPPSLPTSSSQSTSVPPSPPVQPNQATPLQPTPTPLMNRSTAAPTSQPPAISPSNPPTSQQVLEKPVASISKPPPPPPTQPPPPGATPPAVSTTLVNPASIRPSIPSSPSATQNHTPLYNNPPHQSPPSSAPPPAQPMLHHQASSSSLNPSSPSPDGSTLKVTTKVSTLLDDPSMKGALAEAELAKARVENRLKIERERRHSLGSMSSPRATDVMNGNMDRCMQCTLEFPKGSKSDHDQLHCSMRMQTCPTCQSSMRAKDVASHLCDKPVAKCKHCLADVVDVLDHESKCEHALKQCPHCLRRQKMADLQEHINTCDCRLVQCPNACGGKFLQRGLEKHVLTKCPKRPQPTTSTTTTFTPAAAGTTSSTTNVAPPRPKYPEVPKPTSEAKVECKYCDEEYTAAGIDGHEQSCDWKPKRCQFCNMVIISRDLARHETNCKQSNRQCAHCQQTFASPAYAAHVPKCPKRPIKCIRCGDLFAADIIAAHSTACKPGDAKGAIPPPPSTPPPVQMPQPASPSKRRSEGDLRRLMTTEPQGVGPNVSGDRNSRRNFALSQLTAPQEQTPHLTTARTNEVEEDDDVDEDEQEDDMEDDVTLAQVVAEWNVDHVCLWLREDVGVPDVVVRTI
ncbi:hypothetical protein, variant 1 [Aphanomyces astaci]|uniref:TRAF-type domain-containing protein n=1 Tax=Aphanomyces astaci TaxID=112090 RepID=W4FYS0_APHAT|nr:hypothetical protein, variant 1 [Aphanomyces astaci]ETV72131.1 hypothetical protein, variant 1 [Aphanomyces astaci]|eukprot:XP_009838574.1 hypothetical protein, variant 1 [Aphanomyces astaci]